jgi:hypothetical protein
MPPMSEDFFVGLWALPPMLLMSISCGALTA